MNCNICKTELIIIKRRPSQNTEKNDSFVAITICPQCHPDESKTLKALEANHEDSITCGYSFALQHYKYREQ